MISIGIDPGLTGAIAIMYGPNDYEVADIPIMARGKGKSKVKNQVNAIALRDILSPFSTPETYVCVYLERISAMPGQGVASMFSMGDTWGCIRGVLHTLEIPTEIITPQSWKRFYKLGKDKEIVRAKAIELFPAASLSRKSDHNRAEALLIANYGMQQ